MDELPDAFVRSAQALLGPKGWITDATQRDVAATPWRGGAKGITPAIARPAETASASRFLALCHAHRVAVTAQGGNTGLVDGGTPHGEVTLSLSRMNAVRTVDAAGYALTAEAGATLQVVRDAAEAADRLFPLSLGSQGSATLGGLIATNAGGVQVLRYGMMRDLLLGLEVVLADGSVWEGLSALRKNNTGYDLKHLFAGSEGTLGIVTAATLKLFPRAQNATAWVACPSAEAALTVLERVKDCAGDAVTAFELLSADAVALVAESDGISDPLNANAPWRVLVEISDGDGGHARNMLETALAAALEAGSAADAQIAQSEAQAQRFWRIRETVPLAKRSVRDSVNHDIAVPVSAIPAFLSACEAAVCEAAPEAGLVVFGHAGDGNLHYSAVAAKGSDALQGRRDAITAAVHSTVLAHGGSLSAEHGVGRLKRDELAAARGPVATGVMKAIKAALDPNGILNPGRVV